MVSFHVPPPENHGLGVGQRSRRDRRRRADLFQKQGGKCHWCRKPMEMNQLRLTPAGRLKENPWFASFEHVKPKSMGGLNVLRNIVLAHAYCNQKRHIDCWPHDPIYGVAALTLDQTNTAMQAAFDKARSIAYVGPSPGWKR